MPQTYLICGHPSRCLASHLESDTGTGVHPIPNLHPKSCSHQLFSFPLCFIQWLQNYTLFPINCRKYTVKFTIILLLPVSLSQLHTNFFLSPWTNNKSSAVLALSCLTITIHNVPQSSTKLRSKYALKTILLDLKTFAQQNHSTFWPSRYLDRTFAQRIGSQS